MIHGIGTDICDIRRIAARLGEDRFVVVAREVLRLSDHPPGFRPLYPDEMPLWDKIETICKRIYRAARVDAAPGVRARLEEWQAAGHGHLPVCIAKTQYSFSADPAALGAPEGFAGFVAAFVVG